jgi:hypothetical protein
MEVVKVGDCLVPVENLSWDGADDDLDAVSLALRTTDPLLLRDEAERRGDTQPGVQLKRIDNLTGECTLEGEYYSHWEAVRGMNRAGGVEFVRAKTTGDMQEHEYSGWDDAQWYVVKRA